MKPACLDCRHRIGHSCYRFGTVHDSVTDRMVPWYVASCRNERVKVGPIDRVLMALKLKRDRCGKRGRFFKKRKAPDALKS